MGLVESPPQAVELARDLRVADFEVSQSGFANPTVFLFKDLPCRLNGELLYGRSLLGVDAHPFVDIQPK
ncbi:MAG: hypothetical protein ABI672_09115 [Vicinamibacteria bacterium]